MTTNINRIIGKYLLPNKLNIKNQFDHVLAELKYELAYIKLSPEFLGDHGEKLYIDNTNFQNIKYVKIGKTWFFELKNKLVNEVNDDEVNDDEY